MKVGNSDQMMKCIEATHAGEDFYSAYERIVGDCFLGHYSEAFIQKRQKSIKTYKTIEALFRRVAVAAVCASIITTISSPFVAQQLHKPVGDPIGITIAFAFLAGGAVLGLASVFPNAKASIDSSFLKFDADMKRKHAKAVAEATQKALAEKAARRQNVLDAIDDNRSARLARVAALSGLNKDPSARIQAIRRGERLKHRNSTNQSFGTLAYPRPR